MRLERIIRRCLLDYYTIFPNRTEALHHLYFVVGNGYDWHERSLKPKLEIPAEGETIKLRQQRLAMIRMERSINRDYKRQDPLGAKLAKETLDKRVKCRALLCSIYPPHSDYSKFFTMPRDVHPEFVRGAIEAAEDIIRTIKRRPSRVPKGRGKGLVMFLDKRVEELKTWLQ